MHETLEITHPQILSLADAMSALEAAATAHAIDLGIDFPNMLKNYGALWMIARSRLCLTRLPKGEARIKTWLRKPMAAVSNRDFDLFDEGERIGRAVQSWVLVDAERRTILNMKNIPTLSALPTPQPERTDSLRRLSLPELPTVAEWVVSSEEVDQNGHLNNVRYIRHAEPFAPENALCLDVIFDRECFSGETITLQAEGAFVQGLKSDGFPAFRAKFYEGGKI